MSRLYVLTLDEAGARRLTKVFKKEEDANTLFKTLESEIDSDLSEEELEEACNSGVYDEGWGSYRAVTLVMADEYGYYEPKSKVRKVKK